MTSLPNPDAPLHQRPVVFLDIDDVLCPNDPFTGFDAIAAVQGRHKDPDRVFQQLFSSVAIEALRRVHAALEGDGLPPRYVISSTWRLHLGREQLRDVFMRGGLSFVANHLDPEPSWCTPPSPSGMRSAEILDWLGRHHAGEPFVVIDDDESGLTVAEEAGIPSHPLHGRAMLCLTQVCLEYWQVPYIVQSLRTPASDYSQRARSAPTPGDGPADPG